MNVMSSIAGAGRVPGANSPWLAAATGFSSPTPPRRRAWHALLAAGVASVCAGGVIASDYKPEPYQPGKDVVWVPTAEAHVNVMLDMVQLTPQDYLVDLGSGDGITVITAAKRGARAHGIEYNPELVALSQRNAAREGVAGRATFAQGDIFESDFSTATVVSLFLLPELNLRLRPTLLAMKPGTRIVSNTFDMGDWQPDVSVSRAPHCDSFCTAHRWTVPARVEGTWRLDAGELSLTQRFQLLDGSLRVGADSQPVADARLDGTQLRFTIGDDRYRGEVRGDTMSGTVNESRAWRATRVSRGGEAAMRGGAPDLDPAP